MEEKPLTYEIVDSIERIPRGEWDAVCGDLPEGYDFHRAIELAAPPGFSFFYALVADRRRLLALAPLFICDFELDIPLAGAAGALIRRVRKSVGRYCVARTLFCGSPFGERGLIGVRPGVADRDAVVGEILRAMDGFSRARRVPFIVFKDFTEEDAALLAPLLRSGFARVPGLPNVVTDLDAPTFDGYLAALSRATRKDVRRKVKKALVEARVRVEIAGDVAPIADEIYRLYCNTWGSGGARFGKLTREFFAAAGRTLGPGAKFFLYRADGRLAAFNLCIAHGDLLLDKFIGFDYDISRAHNLYFVSWFCNIEWCLEHGIRRYQSGQNGYGPKLRLGGRRVPLYVYLRHRNPLADRAIKAAARVLVGG